jgi:hypothetical protein
LIEGLEMEGGGMGIGIFGMGWWMDDILGGYSCLKGFNRDRVGGGWWLI